MRAGEGICGKGDAAVALERLDKVLASTGRWTRKEGRELIRRGRVTVDGVFAQKPEDKLDPEVSRLEVDGEAVDCAPFVYLMMNKPAGVVSATGDPRQKTVLDLLPERLRRRGLFPVGRLDKDTTGLLLLTDDGALAHALLSPRRHVYKSYYVEVDGVLEEEDVRAFAAGMTLAGGLRFLPAELKPAAPDRGFVKLREGKYHQIKRMLAARGKPVLCLERVSFGPLGLDPRLERGSWRPLTPEERAMLRSAAGGEA